MFFKKKKPTDENLLQEESPQSLISLSDGTVLLGDLQTKSNIRVDCDVRGKIMTSGRVVVSERARIDGNIKCSSALVLGQVKGNIVSSGAVSLKRPAKVVGNILATAINMEEGVVINGMYKIIDQEEKRPVTAPEKQDEE